MPSNARDALVSRVADAYVRYMGTPSSHPDAATYKAAWIEARADLREWNAAHDTPTEGAAS